MTDLLEHRSSGTAESPARGGYETLGTAALAALWALAAGLLGLTAVVLVGWLLDDTGIGVAQAAQVSLQAYLLAHGGSLSAAWGTLGIVPLGLTLLPAWLLVRAGAALARRRSLRTAIQIGEAVAALAVVYAVLVTMLTALAGNSAVSVSPWRAGVGAGLLAGLAASAGALRVTGLGLLPISRLPGPRRAVAAAAAAGGLTLVVGGALTLAISLALDTGRYAELSRAVAPSWTGAVGLALLGALLLPNAIVYAITVGVGPGFALGRGTSVGAWNVDIDTVPALPLLAALPDGGTPPYAALAVPVLAGIVIGLVLVRRLDSEDERGVLSAAGWAALAAVGVALLLGVAAYLAGGPLGSGRLATVGPSGWLAAAYAAVELGVVAAVAAAAARFRRRAA